jgi:uncharacterized membrane protein
LRGQLRKEFSGLNIACDGRLSSRNCLAKQTLIGGLICGAIEAVVGTLGGSAFRGALAKAFGNDLPAALIEDVIAVGGGFLIVSLAR